MTSSNFFSVTTVVIAAYFAIFMSGYFYREVLDVRKDLTGSDVIPEAKKDDEEDVVFKRDLFFFFIFVVAPCLLLLFFIGRFMQKSLDRVLYPSDNPAKVTRSHVRCEKVDGKKIFHGSIGGAKESSVNEGSIPLGEEDGNNSKEANSFQKLRDSTISKGEKLLGSSRKGCDETEVLGVRSKVPGEGVSLQNQLLLRENQDKRKISVTGAKTEKHTHKKDFNIDHEDSGEEVAFHLNDVYLISQALNSADKSSDDLSE